MYHSLSQDSKTEFGLMIALNSPVLVMNWGSSVLFSNATLQDLTSRRTVREMNESERAPLLGCMNEGLIHCFADWLTDWLTDKLTRKLIDSWLADWLTNWLLTYYWLTNWLLTHWLADKLTPDSLTRWQTDSQTHWQTDSWLTDWLTNWLTHSLTDSLTDKLTR